MSLQKRINKIIPGNMVIAYVKTTPNQESSCKVEFHYLPDKIVISKELPIEPSELQIIEMINDAGKDIADAQSNA